MLWYEKIAKKIYLTVIKEIPIFIKDNVEIINLQVKWNALKIEDRKKILLIFNLNINSWSYKMGRKNFNNILAIIKDNIISEEEKIKIYKELTRDVLEENLLIKPHPKEKTNYSKKFLKAIVLNQDFSLEIFMLLNIKVKEIRTISSTEAFGIIEKIENQRREV